MGKDRYKLVANNKKAYHDYFIDETYEAGVALHGTEVKRSEEHTSELQSP